LEHLAFDRLAAAHGKKTKIGGLLSFTLSETPFYRTPSIKNVPIPVAETRHVRPIRSTKSSRFAITLTPNRTRSDSELIGFFQLASHRRFCDLPPTETRQSITITIRGNRLPTSCLERVLKNPVN
jgi:hypothetical protein